jgi:serine/threonine protein phosphatase 1
MNSRFMCCNTTHQNSKFSKLGSPHRVWAVGSVHGDINKLTSLHDNILKNIKLGDRIVYLGNYTGHGDHSAECIDELLTFRRMALAIPGMRPSDLVYLRGTQEEMLQKLLQLQFATNPADVLLWMLGNGLSNTLKSYGLCPHDGIESCRQGVMELIKWTHVVRQAIRERTGHEMLSTQLKQAALTDKSSHYPMLFVNSGLEPDKDLSAQGDSFWWASDHFEAMSERYKPFEKIVRGYDPAHKGVHLNCITATIDGGCGFGGTLAGAAFTASGDVEHLLEV